MRTLNTLSTTLTAAALVLASSQANALTLDFGDQSGNPQICSYSADGLGDIAICSDGRAISQTYGDVAGQVDVTYSTPRAANPQSLLWWARNYNSLYGVAWADGSDSNSRARIELKPLASGSGITLTNFDLGAYPNTTLGTTVNIYAIGGSTPIYTFSGSVGDIATNSPTSFAVNIHSDNGLWIEWQDSAYNVGIDHISYSVVSNAAPVPEPEMAALMLVGLIGVGAVARRRRT